MRKLLVAAGISFLCLGAFAGGQSQQSQSPVAEALISQPSLSQTASQVTSSIAENTDVAAVLIRADWCEKTKAIEPKINSVKAADTIDGVQHVTLDFTDRDETAFYAAAERMGLREIVKAQLQDEVKTGLVLLIDMNQNAVLAELREDFSEEQMKVALMTAAAKE